MINSEALQREKILFAYTTALERGDFERLEQILEGARGDAALERQIHEINTALCEAQPAPAVLAALGAAFARLWPRVKSFAAGLWAQVRKFRPPLRTVAVGLGAFVIVIFGVLALLGPAIGKTFTNVGMPLPTNMAAYNYPAYPGYNQAAAPTAVPRVFSQLPAPTSAPARTATPIGIPYSPGNPNQPALTNPQQTERMIVREGSLAVMTADTRLARQAATDLVAQFAAEGAFIVSSTETYPYGDQMPLINMTLRVPVQRYDASMTRLASLGEVVNRVENAQDVTQSYVDTTARIEALQASRARLLQIIAEAKNTDDLLRAEQELSRREAELEAAIAVQQNLVKTSALSSISLELRPTITSQPVAPNAWDPGVTLHNAVSSLLATLRNLADGSIFFAVTTLPWLLLFGLLIFAAIRFFLKRAKK